MFDIGFSELMVIAVVALLVIGPERLPKVARTAGLLFGRLQRYVNDVKADINREMELDELRRLRGEFENAAQSVQQSVNEVDQQVRSAEHELTSSVSDAANAALPSPTEGSALPESGAASAKPASEAKV
jgi:sec-independent protein translocase protein TatB